MAGTINNKTIKERSSTTLTKFGPLLTTCKVFIMWTEFYKNISDWIHDYTDHKNGIDFFMRLVKWPRIAVKPNFLEILETKIVQFWYYTKLIKTKNMLLHWYYSTKKVRKIRMIVDVENRVWKSDFGILDHLTSLMKKSRTFLWSVQTWLQSEMFLSNSVDMMKDLHLPTDVGEGLLSCYKGKYTYRCTYVPTSSYKRS